MKFTMTKKGTQSKRVPISINKETGEKYLNFSYMILSDATKKLKKLRAQKTPKSFKKHWYMTMLRIKILIELITFEITYNIGEVFNKVKQSKRYLFRLLPQKIMRGFDDRELWNLDMTLIIFIIKYLEPRLEGFYKMKRWGHPGEFNSQEEWEVILKEILEGFSIIKREGILDPYGLAESERLKVQRSIELFSKYWTHLWD